MFYNCSCCIAAMTLLIFQRRTVFCGAIWGSNRHRWTRPLQQQQQRSRCYRYLHPSSTTRRPFLPATTVSGRHDNTTAVTRPHRNVLRIHRRYIIFGWRIRGGFEDEDSIDDDIIDEEYEEDVDLLSSNTDVSRRRRRGGGGRVLPPKSVMNGECAVSVCSVRGSRMYMEDEFFIASDFCAVFDGHGGKAVSRYLRQNLYANLQAALPAVMEENDDEDEEKPATNGEIEISSSSSGGPILGSAAATEKEAEEKADFVSIDGEGAPFDNEAAANAASTGTIDRTVTNHTDAGRGSRGNCVAQPTVEQYENALRLALDRVDREVTRINHWSFQGSTAVCVWLHEAKQPADASETKTTATPNSAGISTSSSSGNAEGDTVSPSLPPPPRQKTAPQRTLVVANIGDSRAVLSRGGVAWELTRDHKPEDPVELERIVRAGGSVTWHGERDFENRPVAGTGIFRVNGRLALSRAVGDRAERPLGVTAEPDITSTAIISSPPSSPSSPDGENNDEDEFVVLGTDGLWDVMLSSEVVDYVRTLFEGGDAEREGHVSKDTVATLLVQEALRRGAHDNVTVIVLWLS